MDKWLVVYDSPDDGRRAQVAKILDGYGDRVQRSVFEVRAVGEHLERMLARLRAVADPEQDSIRLYPCCDSCAGKVICLTGENTQPWWEPDVIIV